MQGSRTTAYHSQGNGQVERFNRTLLLMLGTLTVEQRSNWKQHLNKVVHAYNVTIHEATGHSPHCLMFGRSPRLPIDLAFDLPNHSHEGSESYPEYVKLWKTRMKEAYDLARANTQTTAGKNKDCYDRKPVSAPPRTRR